MGDTEFSVMNVARISGGSIIDILLQEPATEMGSAFSSRLMRQLGASKAPTPTGNGPLLGAASRAGSLKPKGALRMDATGPEQQEEQLTSSDEQETVPPNKRRRANSGLLSNSTKRQQGEEASAASRAEAAAAEKLPRKAAAAPAPDMARLLSRASAAANVQKRQPTEKAANGRAASDGTEKKTGREGRSDMAASSAAWDASASDDSAGSEGMEEAVQKRAPRRSVRGRGAATQESEAAEGIAGRLSGSKQQLRSQGERKRELDDDEEPGYGEDQSARGDKPRGKAGRGLFGAAMAGLQRK